jgi:putative ABC transport system permease protein
MKEEPRWRRYTRLWGPDARADVDDELRHHVERLVEEYRASGVSAEDAERLARARFGDFVQYEEACIGIDEETAMRQRRRNVLDTLWQDVRFGVRQLRANGLVTLTALITIALAIGATTAIFSVVNAVLLRPLPYTDVDELMVTQMSVPEFRELRDRQQSYEDMTVWASNRYNVRGDSPEEVLGAIVEPNFFTLLMQPSLGRAFTEEEASTPVAVIGEALWRRRFNGSPSVLGQTITLGDTPYTIVGVMPRSFQYPNVSFEVWVPLRHAMATTPQQMENRSLRIFRVVARLRPDATRVMAAAELEALSREWQAGYPQTNAGLLFEVIPLSQQMLGDIRPRLTVLFVAVSLVLLIACVNVANLQLSATARRAREMAVRRALGAPRGRLLRQLLTESVVLAIAGGISGVVLASLLLRLLPFVAVDVPRINEVTLDPVVLMFALAASLATALLFGIAPAVQGSRAHLRDALQEGGRGGIGMRAGGRLRATLVAAEVAISIVVLVGAGLLVRSLARVLDQDLGIRAEQLVHANTGLFYFDETAERVARLEQALERVAALDGVTAVAASSGLPPQTAQRGTGFSVIGRTPDEAEQGGAFWVGVTPRYFSTVGGRIVSGRDFDARDRAGAMPVALINESFAQVLFGDGDAVGRQMTLTNTEAGEEVRTIVGVVNDIRYRGVEVPAERTVYTPFAQTPFMWAYVMVRTQTPADRMTPALRNALGSVDPRMTPSRVVQHTEIVSSLLAQRRFITSLLGSFAVLALLLAAVGIYGVTAASVGQRRREIGVRIALGAMPHIVLGQVVSRALFLVVAGLVLGVVASLWLTRTLNALLFEVGARDPAAFVLGGIVMVTVAIAASAIPAWRAARLDPVTTLREQ